MTTSHGGTSSASRRQQLLALLATSLRSTDTTMLRLQKLFSNASSTDSALCTLNYTITLLHTGLRGRLGSNKTTTGMLARTTDATSRLAGLISEFRIFVRVWGLLGLYAWGRSTYLDPPADVVVQAITWAQVVVSVFYQVLENGAYLASKGVLNSPGWTDGTGARRQARWWLWSSRFWAAQVGLEFLRLAYVWRQECTSGRVVGGEKEAKLEWKAKRERWWRDIVSNAGYAPLTIHWSVEDGCVSDTWVGVCGMIAGGVNLREKWRQTAT